MSVSSLVLLQLKDSLRQIGGYKIVAEKVGCTPEWVGQVIRDPKKASKHPDIIKTATQAIKDAKAKASTLDQEILEAIQ